jgi:hypothetical protein
MAEPGDGLRDLDPGDELSIDSQPLSDAVFRVSDVAVEDIGLTEVVVVGLTVGCERYALKGIVDGDEITLSHVTGDNEWDIELTDVVIR